MSKTLLSQQTCPCTPKNSYHDCCQPYHLGKTLPATAEVLMRSRYSAYVLQLRDYLKETWHPSTCPDLADLTERSLKWISLTINNSWLNQQANEAFVEFTARYKINGKAEKMHEISRFVFEDNKWLYVDGQLS